MKQSKTTPSPSKELFLKKGQAVFFLGYQIKNSLNNDGIVLSKPDGELYESHLGNYGTGTKENVEFCKKDALIHFMIARPETFAGMLCSKIRTANSGSYHEYYLLRDAINKAGFEMPSEITPSDGINSMIYFDNIPLTTIKTAENETAS